LFTLQSTTDELAKVKLDWENDVAARRNLQQQNAELRLKLAARPYVALVIDADGYVFRRSNEGTSGGERAADALFTQVMESIKDTLKNVGKCDVIVEAYGNVEGLGQSMVKRGKMRSTDELRQFWSGFVSRKRFFNFVDVGHGKEKADQKIRGKERCPLA